MSNIQLYRIIVRCEQRDGPPRPSAHHVTGRLKKKNIYIYIYIYIFHQTRITDIGDAIKVTQPSKSYDKSGYNSR